MAVDDTSRPGDAPEGAADKLIAPDVAQVRDEGTPQTDSAAGPDAVIAAAGADPEAPAADRDEDTPERDAVARAADVADVEQAESSRWLMQVHVEGPKGQFGTSDPDGIRSDNYWMPLDDLVTDDPRLANGTWGALCDRLEIVGDDPLRTVYSPDQQVKQWDLVAAEHGLPADWGARTQATFARVPDDVTLAPAAVEPARYAPWKADGDIVTYPEPVSGPIAPGDGGRAIFEYHGITVPMGNEYGPDILEFKPDWIHGSPHEVPELADSAIADATQAAGGDPLGTAIELATAMSDRQLMMDKQAQVVVTDDTGPVDNDQRFRLDGAVPRYDANGEIAVNEYGPDWEPVGHALADYRARAAASESPPDVPEA